MVINLEIISGTGKLEGNNILYGSLLSVSNSEPFKNNKVYFEINFKVGGYKSIYLNNVKSLSNKTNIVDAKIVYDECRETGLFGILINHDEKRCDLFVNNKLRRTVYYTYNEIPFIIIYANDTINTNVNFGSEPFIYEIPPGYTSPDGKFFYLIKKDNNYLYYDKVEESWKNFNITKENLELFAFKSINDFLLKKTNGNSILNDLGDYKIVIISNSGIKNKLQVRFDFDNFIIKTNKLFNLKNFKNLNSVNLFFNLDNFTNCKFLIEGNNGVYGLVNNKLTLIEPTVENIKLYSFYQNELKNLYLYGLSDLDFSNFGFYFIFSVKNATTEMATYINKLVLSYDTQGVKVSKILNKDYKYNYDYLNKKLNVELYKKGNYKINYQDEINLQNDQKIKHKWKEFNL